MPGASEDVLVLLVGAQVWISVAGCADVEFPIPISYAQEAVVGIRRFLYLVAQVTLESLECLQLAHFFEPFLVA